MHTIRMLVISTLAKENPYDSLAGLFTASVVEIQLQALKFPV